MNMKMVVLAHLSKFMQDQIPVAVQKNLTQIPTSLAFVYCCLTATK
jgi:hypothetical protein